VVEHHVEDDFDAGRMERFDHIAELVDGAMRILP